MKTEERRITKEYDVVVSDIISNYYGAVDLIAYQDGTYALRLENYDGFWCRDCPESVALAIIDWAKEDA